MTTPYTSEFIDYADMARYDLLKIDDAWVLANSGGETRLYLRRDSGAFVVTRVDRAEPEGFVMSAPDIVDVERYLTTHMGSTIRSLRRIGLIYRPLREKFLVPGWTVLVGPDGYWRLSDPDGRWRVTFNDDDAVGFSWIADASLEDLRASYLDPGGAPLFVDERWHSVWK